MLRTIILGILNPCFQMPVAGVFSAGSSVELTIGLMRVVSVRFPNFGLFLVRCILEIYFRRWAPSRATPQVQEFFKLAISLREPERCRYKFQNQ